MRFGALAKRNMSNNSVLFVKRFVPTNLSNVPSREIYNSDVLQVSY